ncbi:MAG: hypothetical protein JXA21_12110 [Anaerolineae bacterium]|nr:hypothetical protein [Anaerolineae bacterium]
MRLGGLFVNGSGRNSAKLCHGSDAPLEIPDEKAQDKQALRRLLKEIIIKDGELLRVVFV